MGLSANAKCFNKKLKKVDKKINLVKTFYMSWLTRTC